MKKRLFGGIALFTSFVLLTILSLTNVSSLSVAKGNGIHNEHCHWNHYQRVEPTYSSRGIQEYYVCCDHHDSVLEAPVEGTITDAGAPSSEFINSLADDDFRMIPSYQEQLEPIQSEIDKIPNVISPTDGSLIDKAYREYNQLSDSMKGYVQRVSTLNNAYTSYHQNYGNLIDTTLNEYQYKIYNSTYDLECGYDNTYGYYSSFDNIVMHQDVWFSLGKNSNTIIYDYNELVLYVYNDASISRDIDIRDQYSFRLFSRTHLAPHAWTKVNIPMDVFTTYKLTDLFIGSYIGGDLSQTVTDGFKFTSLYGVKGKTIHSNYIDTGDEEAFDNNVTLHGDGDLLSEDDYVVHIVPDNYSASKGSVNFITTETYSNVTKISADIKIDGTSTGWWGFGHASSVANAQIYTGMISTSASTTNNGFSHFDFSCNITGPEYIYFIVEVNTFRNDIYIDNIVITCGNVTYTDDFNSGSSTLFNNSSSVLKTAVSFEQVSEEAYYMDKTEADYAVNIDTGTYGGATDPRLPTLVTANSYSNITKIAFDYKIEGTMIKPSGDSIWWGFSVNADKNADVYQLNTFHSEILTTNNEWTHKEYTGSASGYVRFVINPEKTTCPLYLDNIAITYANGTVVEGFTSSGGTLFEIGEHCSISERAVSSVRFNGGTLDYDAEYRILVDAWTYGNVSGNQATLHTINKYSNITRVSFDLMIEGEITESNPSDYWIGIGYHTEAGASIYKNINLRNLTTTNNEYRHFDFNLNVTDASYINFCSNPGHGHNNLYIDNFVIVANGITYTDGIDNGESSLFYIGQNSYIYEEPIDSFDDINVYNSLVDSRAYFEGPEFIKDGLSGNESLIFGSITHEIIGGGQYAILLYNDTENVEFLLVNGTSIRLFNNKTLVNSVNLSSSTYNIVVANNGKVSINYEYLGQVSDINNQLRIASFFNDGKVLFTSIKLSTSVYTNNSTETIDGILVPNFEGYENVVFASYASPTVANWAGTNNPSMMTDDVWKDYADAGFSKAIPLFEGRTPARAQFNDLYDQYLAETDPVVKESLKQQWLAKVDIICQKANTDAMQALALAEKYGIKYVVLNAIVFELIHHTTPNGNFIQPEDYAAIFDHVFDNDYEYFYQMNYVGNFLQDEPLTANDNAPLIRLLSALTLYYQYAERIGVISEPIVNLLPGGYTDYYTQYLNYYFEHIAPMIGYVSFDQYVLDYNNGSYSIRTEHLANLEMMAQRILASDYRIQLRTYIFPRAQAEGSHRAITMADELRFQIYTNLAFGASEIIYYGYTTSDNSETTYGLVNMYTLAKSDVYYFAKEVNNEVLTFGAAYHRFDWEGAIAKEKSIFSQCSQMRQMQYAISSHKGLSSYTVSQHTLIGCFSNPNDQDAYVVVHYNDPKTNTSAVDSVKLTFNSKYNAIIVYQNGEKHAYRLTNHAYTLSLKAGCGAFVIPVTVD